MNIYKGMKRTIALGGMATWKFNLSIMATHSSILPGESHGQRSLVGYSPWQRVGHD